MAGLSSQLFPLSVFSLSRLSNQATAYPCSSRGMYCIAEVSLSLFSNSNSFAARPLETSHDVLQI